MASFSNRAFISCSIARTCWGGHLGGQNPHEPGRARPKLYLIPFSYSLSGPNEIYLAEVSTLSKILLAVPASRDWFLDLYLFVQSERRPEAVNRQEASALTVPKPSSEGAGIPRPLRFRVDLGICARWRPLRPEAHEVAGLADRSPEDIEGRRAP